MVLKQKEQWVFNQEQESWYYLKSDGQKAQKEWIQQGQEKYYLKEDGKTTQIGRASCRERV